MLNLGELGRDDEGYFVLRPVICYLSQYDRGTMMQFITEQEYADCYLEKPLPFKEFVSLLRLINFI